MCRSRRVSDTRTRDLGTTSFPASVAHVAPLAALVAADGSAGVAFALRLAAPGALTRDLADAVHSLCALHGRHPGMIDHALARTASPAEWLVESAHAFASERAYLARLTSAAGPLPSTPGQAESAAAVAGQRHAFDMLVRSDRAGCAIGAAAALVLDWRAVRAVLNAAARRFGVNEAACALPSLAVILADLDPSIPIERARAFAAQQVLAQHRGLWQLLESRAVAREHL